MSTEQPICPGPTCEAWGTEYVHEHPDDPPQDWRKKAGGDMQTVPLVELSKGEAMKKPPKHGLYVQGKRLSLTPTRQEISSVADTIILLKATASVQVWREGLLRGRADFTDGEPVYRSYVGEHGTLEGPAL